MRSVIGIAIVLAVSSLAIAQDKPDNLPQMTAEGVVKQEQPPALTPDELTAFDTVKAMEALAQGEIAESREWKAYAKAVAEQQERLKAVQAKLQATAQWKTAMALRQKLDARVKTRTSMAINWQTGALAPPPPAQARR